MKKFLPILLLAITPACYADLSHSITSSVKLTVGGATTSADRIGSSYSVSGTGVDTTYTSGGNAVANGVGSLVISSGVGTAPDLTVTQDVPANSFSFSQSFTQADAIATSAPSTGAVSAYSDQTSTAAGVAGALAGTIDSSSTLALTAGGAGTVATGQFVSEISIK